MTRAVRELPGGGYLLKGITFVVGALLVALGAVLIILPGPLTIPPVLLGVYVLSLEFAWAARLRQRTSRAGRQAWSSAKAAPWRTALVTASGLVVLGAGIWAADRWSLVERVLDQAPGLPG